MTQDDIYYYQKEISYLNQTRKIFIDKFPKLAPFLSHDSKDPDIERIIENLAILTSKIHQELDQNIPYIAESLINILSPNYTNILPSMCMQEFQFNENSKLNKLIIPKNSIVKSIPIEKCECEFKTIYDVYLYPLTIENVFLGSEKQYHTMNIQLRVSKEDLNIEHLELDKLNIYLGDDVYTSSTLLFYIHQHLEELKIISHDTNEEFKINTYDIKTMGLKSKESCLFYNDLGFESFSLLREYFFLPEKFNFISIQGLDVLRECKGKQISIFFKFNKTLPKNCIVKNELFSLSTTPIINVFEKAAEPIINNHTQNGYRIFIDRTNLDAYDIVQIKQVKAHNSDSGSRILKNYKNFERFEFMQNKICDFYYITNKSNSKHDNFKEISFLSSNETNETITIDTLCCNKNLPTLLKIGEINLVPFHKDVTTKNITLPTPTRQIKVNGNLLWKLVSILSFSYQTLLTKTSFFQVLESYSFPDDKESEIVCQLLTSSIIDIKSKSTYLVDEYITKKGTMSIISIDDSKFYSLGEVYKLGLIISEFLSSFVSINSFCELKIKCINSKIILSYPFKKGNKPVL